MKGTVFNIQRFSIHDGPSIRTAVFFKGCPLRCAWCHNPEGLSAAPVLSLCADKCIGCRACEAVCARGVHSFSDGAHAAERTQCIGCGACAESCPSGALEIYGKEYTVDEIVKAVIRDKPFYRDGGGATLTGGEPLAQGEFAVALAKALKENGVGVCVETSGYAKQTVIQDIAPYTDLFLFDIKETDEERHLRCTGVGVEKIYKNLYRLNELGANIILRCPIIPGVNNRAEHFDGIAALASGLNGVKEIHLEPYHPMGIEKNLRIGRKAAYENTVFMDPDEIAGWSDYLKKRTEIPVFVM